MAEAALAARYVPMIGALMGNIPRDERIAIELSLGSEILANLSSYTRAPMPPKPTEIEGYTPTKLVDKVRFVSASSRSSTEDRELVSAFTTWRYAVLKLESENSGRVESLLWIARKLDQIAKDYPADAARLNDLALFLEAEWGVTIPPIPSLYDAQRVAFHAAFERDVLPNCLRSLSDPTFVSQQSETYQRPKRGGEPRRLGSWMDDFEARKNESEEA